MKHKNTNDGRSSSPNILTYWKKVFGVFLLLLSYQFHAQITVSGGAQIFSENEEIQISKISTDSIDVEIQATIYINSGTEISGADFIAGNFEVVEEENLPQLKVSDTKNIALEKNELTTAGESTKRPASEVENVVTGYHLKSSDSENTFCSTFFKIEIGLSSHQYHYNFFSLNKSDSIPAGFDNEKYCICSLYSSDHRRNFQSNEFSVRPPPFVVLS